MATVTRRLAALLGASGAEFTDSATASKITTDSINDDAVNAEDCRLMQLEPQRLQTMF